LQVDAGAEPEEEDCFADFYPELTLSEVNVGLPTHTTIASNGVNESADLELPSNPYISNHPSISSPDMRANGK